MFKSCIIKLLPYCYIIILFDSKYITILMHTDFLHSGLFAINNLTIMIVYILFLDNYSKFRSKLNKSLYTDTIQTSSDNRVRKRKKTQRYSPDDDSSSSCSGNEAKKDCLMIEHECDEPSSALNRSSLFSPNTT